MRESLELKVSKLGIKNFRPYEDLNVEFDDYVNLITGSNATGKTSIVESIYMLGITKSHRSPDEMDVIRKDTEFARICGKVELNHEDTRLDLLVSQKGKRCAVNKVEQKRISDYVGRLNVVMFSPEDLGIIKGNPKDRRKFMDLELGQASKKYLNYSLEYKNIMKQRNELLKKMDVKKYDEIMLDVITEQLVNVAEKIIDMRKRFIHKLSEVIQKVYAKITDGKETLRIEYIASIEGTKEELLEAYKKKYQLDILNKSTQYGPHRDDIEFFINEMEVKTFGSQGQQRSIALCVKLALVNLIYQIKGEFPILILDDALSELDINRRRRLVEYIDSKIQTFITTTEIDDLMPSIKGSYKVINTKEL